MKTVLVFGSGGGLGQTFMRLRGPGYHLMGLNHAEADVTDPFVISRVLEQIRPQIVINASGYTAVDKAESEPDAAYSVNVTAVAHLAKACAKRDIQLVTYSTDYVFSGEDPGRPLTERDRPGPRSVYGRTKLEGEQRALEHENALVIRTSWLYSETGKSFPKTILTKAIAGEPLRVVDDQVSSPTFAADLVFATLSFLEAGASGLYHYSCAGEASWHELACDAIDAYNEVMKAELPHPTAIKTSDLKLAAPRPAYSVLDCEKARALLVPQRHWKEALKDFVVRLYSST
ncbi:MAG TPA: dTDP-4-dehydrorhamnose reductase [Bdellovibrionales bacterium]|nr:dTDP-4-dehydrorhamnose reductase [Bdellovibrionales bacterium]